MHDSFDDALDFIVDRAGDVNVYDITSYHDYPDILIGEYLGQPDIQNLFSLNKEIVYSLYL